ncbi:MAG TPA: hypothetical protein VFR12_02670 [Pyrinomonadaceae bacterium]|nr:hypothetical protein [Pyrinomonadaceae bacterium]
MKKLVAVCLGVIVSCSVLAAPRPSNVEFAIAEQVGDPNARSFFVFSTSVGGYVVRHDGFGEFTSPQKLRRAFVLRVPGKNRITSVYFLEHLGDVFLLYEVRGQGSYLVRMEQTKRKQRWSTSLETSNVEAPVIDGDLVVVKEDQRSIRISTADGRIVSEE